MPKLEGASGPWGTRGAAPVRQRPTPPSESSAPETGRLLPLPQGPKSASTAMAQRPPLGSTDKPQPSQKPPRGSPVLPENVPGRAPPHREAGTLRCDLTCVSHTTVTTLSTRRMPCGADSSLSKDDNFPLCLSE